MVETACDPIFSQPESPDPGVMCLFFRNYHELLVKLVLGRVWGHHLGLLV